MGGVLIDLDLTACKEAYKALGFNEIDEILDPCHQKGIFGEMEEGLVTADEYRDYVIARSNPGVTYDQIDKATHKILVGVEPYKIEMLHRLSKIYDIYMLSNNNPIATKRAIEIFSEAGFTMENDFRKCYLSYKLKMLKPSEGFYKAVVADIGLPASEMLFIDDSQRNVDAAISAGLPAIWYQPGTDLGDLIDSYISSLS